MYVHEGVWPCAVVVVYTLVLLTTTALTGSAASPQGRAEDKGVATREDGASVRLAAVGRLEGEGTSELCDSARLQCTVRTGCYMALQNFFIGCNSIITGEEAKCTTACKHALVSLLATEDGAGLAFINCNCSGHQVCEERKQRVQVCQRHVLDSMDLVRDESATVSCSFARWICEADTSCLAALQYYVLHCAKLFQGTKCSARCRNSVHILYRQPNARKLRTCRCEGTEDYDCPKLVANTEKLCFQRHRHGHQPHQHLHNHRHHNSSSNEYLYDDVSHTRVSPATLDSRRQASAVTSLHSKRSGTAASQTTSRRRKRRNKPRKRSEKKKRRRPPHYPFNAMFKDQQKTKRLLKRRSRSRSRGRRQRRRLCEGGGGGRDQKKRRSVVVVVADRDRIKGKGRESDKGERRKCLLSRVRKGIDSRKAKKKRQTSNRTSNGRG